MAPMRTNKQTLWLVAFFAIMIIGYRVWRKLPPYERGLHAADASVVEASGTAPHIERCPVFPADNVWNTPIDKLAKDQHSDAYVAGIGPQQKMHPDFAANLTYGVPFTDMPPGTRPVEVSFEYADESDAGRYPIPRDVPIEGDGKGDAHVIVIDQQRCILYELYNAHPKGDSWTAGSGAIFDLKSNTLRPTDKTSADAAGLPIFPGLVRYDEVAAGEIAHALRFTLPRTQNSYIWPARHHAGRPGDNLPPMGMRFRLRAGFDISHFSLSNRIILNALKRYGMFLADNGSPMYLSGVPDKRWDDSDLRHLNQVTAADFEAVDESELESQPNSGQVATRFRR